MKLYYTTIPGYRIFKSYRNEIAVYHAELPNGAYIESPSIFVCIGAVVELT